ncbi:GPI mannosyltransferase 2 [Aspergillus campestris IBT 28561]|uniref:GPI mannosyltransferase 2 n=1 Tax=Aspergillus campestris (strain IBT 28561) TaxID=1392248 RepID=A0A2I1CY81_ASPC2|nr:GPI mannosyltransferase 2 [Aspergillus campestris IBT 28561]PKY02590.1 GPI mannosyltransferase 2 [Aspergillus campestris IBT 28561]
MANEATTPGSPRLLHLSHPIRSLTIAFGLWKALIFLVVLGCPGPGYDTSTGLLPYLSSGTGDVISRDTKHAPIVALLKFTRWDSIYFVHIAERGYVFEQEWAFGYGYTRILAFLASFFHPSNGVGEAAVITAVGIAVSHISHYLSVLALYRLSVNVFGQHSRARELLCFLTPILHIISPAGAFLSAPYGESLFAMLNIGGFYLYSSAFLDARARKGASSHAKLLLAAGLFAVASTVRSNGVLSGILFAYDALVYAWAIVSRGPSKEACLRLAVTIVGGCIVGLGFVLPQVIAYLSYCTAGETLRPWCQRLIPSIYGWVQEQYWNVGFLRYWTLSNLPLFLLALPMLVLLCWSSIWACKGDISLGSPASTAAHSSTMASLLIRLALPQGILAVLAFTSYHVQIVNRISSGYPLWYWYIAYQILSGFESKHSRALPVAVTSMVMYGLVQATLFGSFLPPA